MSRRADLINIAFASGPETLNRELIDRMAEEEPGLPLFVVSEFPPHRGTWIPFHVLRSADENLAQVRSVLEGRRIGKAGIVLASGGPLAKMRRIALRLAPRQLIAAGWGRFALRRFRANVTSHRARLWVRRLAHPRDAELPLRARAAQMYGLTANQFRRVRTPRPEAPSSKAARGISIVIPSRDGRALLEEMLPPLLAQLREGEVIVSDNGSNDGTSTWLSTRYPGVRVISSAAPLSFARAVNLGIEAAGFRRVLLLNNDMIVAPGFLDALDAAFDGVPGLFCATAQIFFSAGMRREETGKAVWRREDATAFPVRCDLPVTGEDLTWVLYGSGGCSLFDAEKLRLLGGVSEVFEPAYVEDLDLGYRAWKKGWPSVFCAAAKVEHRHRATTARYYTREQLDRFVEKNYLRFLIDAVGSPALFARLWREAIRRLQLNGDIEVLRSLPKIGPRPPAASGPLTEEEILALGRGDIAIFPGRGEGPETVVVASPYLPFPLSHGGAVRIYNLMKRVAPQRGQVLMVFCDELVAPPDELLDICREVILVRRYGTHYRRDTERPDTVEEFDSPVFRACMKQTIARWQPAIVQLEFTQMAQYADACHPARTILVEHDITFDLQQQLLATGANGGSVRREREQQFARWQKFETAAWREVDCVVTMSPKDKFAVSGGRRVACVPNGVDVERFQSSGCEPDPYRLLFIGSFAHLPNLLALELFLCEVWPRLGPEFTLHVIAGNRPEYFLEFHRSQVSLDLTSPRIELEGFAPDVRPAYERAAMVLAPLTASAGTNIKVLEALAMGRTVVSTPAGINGLDLVDGLEVIVTESAARMAEEIVKLAGDPERRTKFEAHARLAALRFDWNEIAAQQLRLYEELGKQAPISGAR